MAKLEKVMINLFVFFFLTTSTVFYWHIQIEQWNPAICQNLSVHIVPERISGYLNYQNVSVRNPLQSRPTYKHAPNCSKQTTS